MDAAPVSRTGVQSDEYHIVIVEQQVQHCCTLIRTVLDNAWGRTILIRALELAWALFRERIKRPRAGVSARLRPCRRTTARRCHGRCAWPGPREAAQASRGRSA